MLYNFSKRIKKEDKENMLLLQLKMNGVSNEKIINAFSKIERADFIPKQHRKLAYQDTESYVTGINRIILRPFILAKTLNHLVDNKKIKNVLVVGDISGYTSAIFSEVFECVSVSIVSNYDLDYLSKNISQQTEVKLINSILSNKPQNFDLVFLDSGFYKMSTVFKIFEILSSEGRVLFFLKPTSFNFSISKFNFINASLNSWNSQQQSVLFSENILMPEEFVL